MLKNLLKKVIPRSLLDQRTKRIATEKQSEYADRTASDTFAEIYRDNIWGGESGEFYSGGGSEGEFAQAYADVIGKFIVDKDIHSVVDLGCGDMRVASKFITPQISYIGCDVVPDLIEYHRNSGKLENTEFHCLNIIEDDLPDGELCLIRQVLQHLSNDEIVRILQKTVKYKYLIVTEHYPATDKMKEPNLDIPHGPNTRLVINSAVVLDAEPFNIKDPVKLFEKTDSDRTRIVTFLISADNR